MSFRTVVVKNRSKLDLKLNHLVCRNSSEETKIYIPEISVLILESTAISLTSALVSELVKNNVKIIFCDENHNPESELFPLYGHYNDYKRLNAQLGWDDEIKARVWTKIIENKIKQQMVLLEKNNKNSEAEHLHGFLEEIEPNDITNREGHAAKVYFNALFGLDFGRRNANTTNSALNYGYAILLSCFNREIVANGYLTQIGIWHKNEFNHFNFACDIMEPFRSIVDGIALSIKDGDDFKSKMLEIFNIVLVIDGKKQAFENVISIYCKSIFEALNRKDESLIKFYEM